MKSSQKPNTFSRVAVIFLNTCLFLAVINFGLFIVFKIQDEYSRRMDEQTNPVSRRYQISLSELKKTFYPDLSEEEINELLRSSWSIPFKYEPFTQFKYGAYKSKHVNVDVHGFRRTKNQGPWPPNQKYFSVFLFGGSTTFNYGVSDDDTIASYLQEFLSKVGMRKEPRLYNFGRGHYYSSQERILFEKLISSGLIPDMAIFIDGLNDFYYNRDEPMFTEKFEYFVTQYAKADQGDSLLRLLELLPMTRAVVWLRNMLATVWRKVDTKEGVNGVSEKVESYYNNKAIIRKVIERYVSNKRIIEAISDSFDIKAIFVWQPSPAYGYELKYHLFAQGFGRHRYSQYGYPIMAALVAKKPLGRNFLWCADVNNGSREAMFVDAVHYSAKMSRKVAECIFLLMKERKHLPIK